MNSTTGYAYDLIVRWILIFRAQNQIRGFLSMGQFTLTLKRTIHIVKGRASTRPFLFYHLNQK